MADTAVVTNASVDVDASCGLWGPYYINETTGVIISIDNLDDLKFQRTTNGGTSWSETNIKTETVNKVAVWFDQETPGDTGTLLHVAWLDDTVLDEVNGSGRYRTVDIFDGSLGTERIIFSADVGTTIQVLRMGITKTLSGNLLVGYNPEDSVLGCKRSTDGGATWVTRANVLESTAEHDHLLLFPANTGDGDDACAIFWDVSASQISVKMYDESANTWTETSIATGMIADTAHINMDAAVRHSDNHILLAAHSNDDTTGDDLRTWDLTVDSIVSPTVTAKTNIFTNQGESAQVAMFINQQNDDVYVAYLKGGTWQSTVDTVFHKSTDGMGIWGTEQAYSEAAADDLRRVSSGRTVGNSGGFYQPAFYNDDLFDIFVNLVNDVAIAAAAGGGFAHSQGVIVG